MSGRILVWQGALSRKTWSLWCSWFIIRGSLATDFEDPAALFLLVSCLPTAKIATQILTLHSRFLLLGSFGKLNARFKTNSDQLPGVERLAVMEPDLSYLEKSYQVLQPWGAALKVALRVNGFLIAKWTKGMSQSLWAQTWNWMNIHNELGELLAPFSIAYVKGWRRGLAALILIEGIRCLGIPIEDVVPAFKASHNQTHWTFRTFLNINPSMLIIILLNDEQNVDQLCRSRCARYM